MRTIETVQQYTELKAKVNAYKVASRQWMHDNRTNGIPFEVYSKFPFADEIDNELRSALEEFEFKNYPPDKYTLYINEKERKATTWTGQTLGTVDFGRPFRTNFGDIRVPINVNGTNGKRYHGTFFKSAGDYATIKAFK